MEAPLAEPGQRLLARIVDTLVVGLPVIVVVRELVSGHTVDVVAPPVVAGCMFVYEAIQLALWGRTLGKRFAGIEVVLAPVVGVRAAPARQDQTVPPDPSSAREPTDRSAGREAVAETPEEAFTGAEPDAGGARAETVTEAAAEPEAEQAADTPETVPIGEGSRPGVLRSVLRAGVYSLPIAARPIPVLGLLGGIFWVANAGMLYEGTRRQAVHDRLTGTLVVKSPPSDSTTF